jgi:hypothetical protein
VIGFKENEIPCMKLHQITCINTNSNTRRVTIELEMRARKILGMKVTKITIGTCARWVGLSFPDGERYSETSTRVGRS